MFLSAIYSHLLCPNFLKNFVFPSLILSFGVSCFKNKNVWNNLYSYTETGMQPNKKPKAPNLCLITGTFKLWGFLLLQHKS